LAGWVEALLAKEPAERPQAAAAWEALEDIVVSIAGPVWRRHARLLEPADVEAGRPLTPAPFDPLTPQVVERPTPEPTAPSPDPAEPEPAVAPSPRPTRGSRRRPALVGAGVVAVLLGAGALGA